MTQSARTDGPAAEPRAPAEALSPEPSGPASPIAIIGMACRFPGADDIGACWRPARTRCGPPAADVLEEEIIVRVEEASGRTRDHLRRVGDTRAQRRQQEAPGRLVRFRIQP